MGAAAHARTVRGAAAGQHGAVVHQSPVHGAVPVSRTAAEACLRCTHCPAAQLTEHVLRRAGLRWTVLDKSGGSKPGHGADMNCVVPVPPQTGAFSRMPTGCDLHATVEPNPVVLYRRSGQACTGAAAAARRCLTPQPNTIRAPGGRRFSRPSRARSQRRMTTQSCSCRGRRCDETGSYEPTSQCWKGWQIRPRAWNFMKQGYSIGVS